MEHQTTGALSRLKELYNRPFLDVPDPPLEAWLQAAHSYFDNRGYGAFDVQRVIKGQSEEIDYLVRGSRRQTVLAHLILAIFDDSASRTGSASSRDLCAAFRALEHCFNNMPTLRYRSGKRSLILSTIRSVTVAIVAVLVTYVVVGAIADGQSDFGLARTYPAIGLGLLALLITILAFIEGSHIGVARLQESKIPENHPNQRVVRVHKLIRGRLASDRFFAGRQVSVIVIIFMVSRLTSFSSLATLPFTQVPLPGGALSFLTIIFIEYGMAGALFVYWIGQMLPQLMATKAPTWVFKSTFGEIVVRVAKLIGDAHIDAPAEAVAGLFPPEEEIPADLRQRYLQVAADSGWSYLLQKRAWSFAPTSSEFSHEHVVSILVPGMKVFSELGVQMPKSLEPKPNTAAGLFRCNAERTEEAVEIHERPLQTVDWGEDVQYWVSASPKWGNFQVGDVLVRTTTGTAKLARSMEDAIIIRSPVQHFLFECSFPESFGINAPTLTVTRDNDPAVREAGQVLELLIEDAGNGQRRFSYVTAYPPVGTCFTFAWAFHDG